MNLYGFYGVTTALEEMFSTISQKETVAEHGKNLLKRVKALFDAYEVISLV